MRIDLILHCDSQESVFTFTDFGTFGRDVLQRFLDEYELRNGIGKKLMTGILNRNKELTEYALYELETYLNYNQEFIEYCIMNYCMGSNYVYAELKLVSL